MIKTPNAKPMRLSKSTLDILKNFSTINQSICFKKGNLLTTLSIQKNILSRAHVEEEFPKDFAIYDLSEFLSAMLLFKDPEFDFSHDSYVVIKDSRNRTRYFFTDPSVITTPPDKRVELPSKDVSFLVSEKDLSNISKAAAIYGVEDLSVVGDGNTIQLVVRDKKNDTSNSYSVNVGKTEHQFCFNFKVETLKLLPGDYSVVVSQHNASLFRNETLDLEYLIALEPDSKYEG
tara:strand:- start:130 stop:825 length:696 start_codon:yes stop_codon:yes gene_type:complete